MSIDYGTPIGLKRRFLQRRGRWGYYDGRCPVPPITPPPPPPGP